MNDLVHEAEAMSLELPTLTEDAQAPAAGPPDPGVIELRVGAARNGEEGDVAFSVCRVIGAVRETVWRGSERDVALDIVANEVAAGALFIDFTREHEIPANVALHQARRFAV